MQFAHCLQGQSLSSAGIKARLSHAQWSYKPQDLVMALKRVCLAGAKVIHTDLVRAMHMSQFEAHACLARQSAARLLTEVGGAPALVMSAFRLLLPLYPKLPVAAVQDAALYKLLAWCGALRIGQAHERELARGLLE